MDTAFNTSFHFYFAVVHVPTPEELVVKYESWKLRCPSEDELKNLSRSKAVKWETKYSSDWKKYIPG